MEQRTMILWTPKRCRRPRWVGSASADGSAQSIRQWRVAARAGRGRLWIVSANRVDAARKRISDYLDRQAVHPDTSGEWFQEGELRKRLSRRGADGRIKVVTDSQISSVALVVDGGRTVALGMAAACAIAGSILCCDRWAGRVLEQGRVYSRQTRALGGADLSLPDIALDGRLGGDS